MKHNFIADYTDYADFRDYVKNVFVTDYADYTDIQDFVKNTYHRLRWVPNSTCNNCILQEIQCSLTCLTLLNHNTISLRVFVYLSFNLYRSCCFTIEFYLGSFFFILMSFLIFFLMLVLHYFSTNSASGLSGANLFPFFLQGRNQKLFKAGEVP